MAQASSKNFDVSRRGEALPYLSGKPTANNLDVSRRGEPFGALLGLTFPNTAILDNFNRTNGTLNGTGIWAAGQVWTGDTTFQIVSNQLLSSGAGSFGDAYTTATYTNSEVYADIVTVPAGQQYFEIGTRLTNPGGAAPSYYCFTWDTGVSSTVWNLNKYVAGTATSLGTYAHVPVAGEKFGISAVGSLITAYYYTSGVWRQVAQATDATLAGPGSIEIQVYGPGVIDNVGGGALTTLVTQIGAANLASAATVSAIPSSVTNGSASLAGTSQVLAYSAWPRRVSDFSWPNQSTRTTRQSQTRRLDATYQADAEIAPGNLSFFGSNVLPIRSDARISAAGTRRVIGSAALASTARLSAIPNPVDLTSPATITLGTALTNSMSITEPFSWSQSNPILIDRYEKLIVMAQDSSSVHNFIYSNNAGATWTTNALSEASMLRASVAYDTVNDILHVLWSSSVVTNGVMYRRYNISRDGSNNITGITNDSNVNLKLDFQTGTNIMSYDHPVMLWMGDAAYGTYGAIVAVWSASNNKSLARNSSLRASMRILSNSTADNTAGNWTSLGATVTDLISGNASAVASSAIQSATGRNGMWPSVLRKAGGTHVKDLYVFSADLSSTALYQWRRLPWNSSSNNWNSTWTTTTTVTNVARAGTDTGYSAKYQLTTKPVESTAADRVYIGFATWKNDTVGDTWGYTYVDSTDTVGSLVDVYSAGGIHTFAPVGDITYDQGLGVLAVSYVKTTTQASYIQTFQGTTAHQGETTIQTAVASNTPLLWYDPLVSSSRAHNGSNYQLLALYASTASPPVGYLTTMNWSAAASVVYTVSINSTGLISATGTIRRAGTASLTSTGLVSAAARRIQNGAVPLSSTGLVSATARRIQNGATNLSSTGLVSAAGSPKKAGVAALTSTGLISATGTSRRFGIAAISSTGLISATASAGLDLSSPTVLAMGATQTGTMGTDSFNPAQSDPIIVDIYDKLIVMAENSSNSHSFVYSNDAGATWSTNSLSEGFLLKSGMAYDSANDILHLLWTAQAGTDGVIYRRYNISRDGSHNITGITKDSNVNLQLDFQFGSNVMSYEHPIMLWLNDAAYGTYGAIVAVWSASNDLVSNRTTSLRASMRVLSNSSADNTAGNWTGLGATVTDLVTGNAAAVATSAVQSATGAGGAWPAVLRKTGGTHVKDLYVFYTDLSGTAVYKWKRLPWNSGSNNWNSTWTTAASISNISRSGTDTGFSFKYQLISKPVEDITNDRVYIGLATWKNNTAGDTWGYTYVDSSDTLLGALVDVYSAAGTHSFAPTGDITFDQSLSVLAVSYIKTSTNYPYVQTFQGSTQHQSETAIQISTTTDVPRLYYNPQTADSRAHNGSTRYLPVVYRNSGSPYTGYFSTLTWAAAPAANTASLTGTGLISAVGARKASSGVIALTSTATLTAAARGIQPGAASLTSTATVSVAAGRKQSAAASLTGSGLLSASGSKSAPDLTSPSVAAMGTTVTASMGPDGFSWSVGNPILVDKYNKLIIMAEDSSQNHSFIYSNDAGATWNTNSLSEGFLTRASVAYDTVNDILHALWTCQNATDGVLYRRYTIGRDGSHNVTGITKDSGVNLQIDFESGSNSMYYEFPTMLWLSDAAYGTYGAIVAVWGASNNHAGTLGSEIRASMRVLSNSSADNTAGNWTSLGVSATTTINNAPTTAYTTIASTVNNGGMWPSVARKLGGTHAKDLYFFYTDLNGTQIWKYRRLAWTSGTNNWNNAPTTAQTISNVVRSGTDIGYNLKFQLGSRPVEDLASDKVYFGLATWKNNTAGDTWSFVSVDNSDTIGSLVDVYSAGGAHSFAPTGDITFDQQLGILVASYSKTSTLNTYIQTYLNGTNHQAETALQTSTSTDIPLLWYDPLTGNSRYNNAGTSQLPVVFRNTASPPVGYYGTFNWAAAISASLSGSASLTADGISRKLPVLALSYKMRETSGTTVVDSIQAFNATASGLSADQYANTFIKGTSPGRAIANTNSSGKYASGPGLNTYFSTTADFSFSTWYYHTTPDPSNFGALFSLNSAAGVGQMKMYYDTGASALTAQVVDTDGTKYDANVTSYTPADNAWNYVAGTWDHTTKTWTLYGGSASTYYGAGAAYDTETDTYGAVDSLTFLNRSDGNRGWDGLMGPTYFWTGKISADEAQQGYDFPYNPALEPTTTSGSASITGAATVSASGRRIQNGSASLNSTGLISASARRIQNGAVSLTSTGLISATAAAKKAGAVSITSTGLISASARRIQQGAASLTSTGLISAAAAAKKVGTASLTSTGLVSASARRVQNGAASLASAATLSVTGNAKLKGASSLTSTGLVSAAARRIQNGAISISSTGLISASPTKKLSGTASLTGISLVSTGGTGERYAAASLSTTGLLQAVPTKITPASASLAAAGTLTASAIKGRTASASLSATGTLTALPLKRLTGAASITGTGTLAVAATLGNVASADLSATGSVTAAGTRRLLGAASLTGTGLVATTPTRLLRATAALAATGTLTALPLKVTSAAANLNGSGVVATAGNKIAASSTSLTSTATVTSSGNRIGAGVANLASAGSLNVTGLKQVRTAASLAGTGLLAAVPNYIVPASASITATASFASHPYKDLFATASLSGTASLSADPLKITAGAANLASAGSLTITGYRVQPASADLMSQTSVTAAGSKLNSTSTDLLGTGLVSSSAIRRRFGAADSTGTAALQASVVRRQPAAADLSSSASLTASAVRGQRSTADLSASGSLSVTGSKLNSSTGADLSSQASITVSADRKSYSSSSLSATGSLSVVPLRLETGAAALSSQGTLATTATRLVQAAASLNAYALFDTGGVAEKFGAASLSSTALLNAVPRKITPASAALSATGTLSVLEGSAQRAAADLTGTASLTIVPTRLERAAASLTGTAVLSTTALGLKPGQANLTGTASVTITSIQGQLGQAALTGTASLTMTALRRVSASSSLTAAATLTAAAARKSFDSAALSSTAAIAATPTKILSAATSLTGAAALAVTARLLRGASAALTGSGAVTATATRRVFAASTITASATLAATGTARTPNGGDITSAATVTAAGNLVASASSSLTAQGTLSASGGARRPAAASISSQGTLAISAQTRRGGSASLAGTAAVVCSSFKQLRAAASLTGRGSTATTGSAVFAGATSVTGQGQLAVQGKLIAHSGASVAGSASISCSGVRGKLASAAMTSSGTLNAAGQRASYGRTAIASSGLVSAVSRRIRYDSANLAAHADFECFTVKIISATAALAAAARLQALPGLPSHAAGLYVFLFSNGLSVANLASNGKSQAVDISSSSTIAIPGGIVQTIATIDP